ncbi:MAG: DUF1559 domain-containing protein [Pirellulales bacterium]
MPRFSCYIGVSLVAALCIALPSLGQTNAPNPDEPPTTRLVIHPAEPPAIAMQHRLLPRYLDLKPGNAAVQYLKALPEGGDAELKKHDERIGELLDQPKGEFQVEEARKIVKEIGTSTFEFLRLASLRTDCDWDLPIGEHELYSILLPELSSLRQFSRYLALRARVQIADGRIEQAIETLRVGYALARNAAKGPTLVNALVSVAIARNINQVLLELIEAPGAPNLYWSIAALPDPFIDTRPAMDFEGDGIYLMFPQLKDVATTHLTDEQWSLRLAEFSQSLSKFGSLLGTDAEAKRWQEKLALGVKIAAVAAVYYPQAKTDLQKYGWSKTQLDSMAVAQVILLHIGQTNEVFRDSMFKWFHVPYWQSQDGSLLAQRQFADTVKSREILPFSSLLLPAVNAARFAVVRLDRQFAAIRTLEAVRFHAAMHDGKLPQKLEDIGEIPIPVDPVTGKMFDYKLERGTATLEGKAPAGRTSETGAFRYVISVAEKGTDDKPRDERPAEQKRDSAQEDHKRATPAQTAASEVAKRLLDLFTTRRAKSINNLKQLALSMHNYLDVYKHFPPAATADKAGKPLLSWRVHVLPYVEEGELYRQFKLDEPWDSEHNKQLIEKMPDIFRVPILPPLPKYTTTYLVPVGEETLFYDDKGTPIKEVRDGVSKTILIVEADADQAVIWSKPGDWQFDPKAPARGLGKLRGPTFLAAFADGSIGQLDPERDKERLLRFLMRADGLPVSR